MTQQADLLMPFPKEYVHSNPSGRGSYVKHHVVEQRLLQVVGPYSFRLVEIVRGDVAEKPPNPNGDSARAKAGAPALTAVIVGAVARLELSIDGRQSIYEECGDCEEPHNWPHDGARLKDAMSDAFKRCAMRAGLGLHLWAQDEFFVYDILKTRKENGAPDRLSPAGDESSDGHVSESVAASAGESAT